LTCGSDRKSGPSGLSVDVQPGRNAAMLPFFLFAQGAASFPRPPRGGAGGGRPPPPFPPPGPRGGGGGDDDSRKTPVFAFFAFLLFYLAPPPGLRRHTTRDTVQAARLSFDIRGDPKTIWNKRGIFAKKAVMLFFMGPLLGNCTLEVSACGSLYFCTARLVLNSMPGAHVSPTRKGFAGGRTRPGPHIRMGRGVVFIQRKTSDAAQLSPIRAMP